MSVQNIAEIKYCATPPLVEVAVGYFPTKVKIRVKFKYLAHLFYNITG